MFESVTTITEMARSKIAMNSFSTIQTEKSGNFSKTYLISARNSNPVGHRQSGGTEDGTEDGSNTISFEQIERFCKGIKVKIISELEDLERQRADKKEPDKNIESRIEDLQNQLLDMLK